MKKLKRKKMGMLKHLFVGASSLALVPAASADLVQVDMLGGAVEMHAGGFDILDSTGIELPESEMALVHSALNDAGITTDGRITNLLAQTDAGLTFITLIDSNIAGGMTPLGGGGGGTDSSLVLSSTGPDSLDRYVNAEGGNITEWELLRGNHQLFSGLFHWNSAAEGDGFAWGGLSGGDAVSYHITDLGGPGLDSLTPFQFLSFGDGGWEVVATADFSAANQFVFSFQSIPAPAALSLLAMGGLLHRRSRSRITST